MKREWRVVSTTRFGTFRVFDEDEQAARDFAFGRIEMSGLRGARGKLGNDPNGVYRLESRPVGGSKDDWREELDIQAANGIGAIYE